MLEHVLVLFSIPPRSTPVSNRFEFYWGTFRKGRALTELQGSEWRRAREIEAMMQTRTPIHTKRLKVAGGKPGARYICCLGFGFRNALDGFHLPSILGNLSVIEKVVVKFQIGAL